MKGTFDPSERAAEKQRQRDQYEQALREGRITPEELRRKNSFFGALDLTKWKVQINRRPRSK